MLLLRNCKHLALEQFVLQAVILLVMLSVCSTPRYGAASFSGVSAMGQMLADGSELCSQGDGSSVGAAGSQGNDVVPKSVLVVDTVLSSHAF